MTCCLALVSRGITFPCLHELFRDFNDLVALPVSHVVLITSLVVTDMVSDRHEDRVIVELAGGTFDRHHIRRFPPKHKDARLNADKGLEGVGMEVETREHIGVLQY